MGGAPLGGTRASFPPTGRVPHATVPAGLVAAADSALGFVPLHSPLLRESRLVSFPPLSYMLKFSG